MINVCHVIIGLGSGGAEAMLSKLVSAMDRSRFTNSVVSLTDQGRYGRRLEELGVDVRYLGLSARAGLALAPYNLVRTMKDIGPDIVQGWMPHGNWAAMAGSMLGKTRSKVLWNIRQTLKDDADVKLTTSFLTKAGARLSRYAAGIIYNSHEGAKQHEEIGYDSARKIIIPNGFDINYFRPSEELRARLRRELGLPESALLAGMVARFHPMKNHAGFIEAGAELARRRSDIFFVLAGTGVDSANAMLKSQINEAGLENRIFLMGEQADPRNITAALDIHVLSSSYGEGFPNVIGEAMACGVPCVATDTGDSGRIIGDTGICVPPFDSQALSEAMWTMLAMDAGQRRGLGQTARTRITEHYALSRVVEQYEALYSSIAAGRKPDVTAGIPREDLSTC